MGAVTVAARPGGADVSEADGTRGGGARHGRQTPAPPLESAPTRRGPGVTVVPRNRSRARPEPGTRLLGNALG
ncbi:unnamed protein product [Lampetra planeri]